MNEPCVLAGDLGSSACKTMVVSVSGQVLASAQQEFTTRYPQPGWVEQDPDEWYSAFTATTRQALAASGVSPGRIAAVGIVGVTHNTVLLDHHDRPLLPSILIFDTRSQPQVRQILDRWGDAVRETALNDVSTVWSWPQLLWIRQNHPGVWRATCRLLFQKDYVRHRLAPSPVTDEIDAGGTLLFDPLAGDWIAPFCEHSGIQPAWLPPVVPSLEMVAKVSRQGAADSGLLEGTPVIAGATDTVAEVLGCGAVRPGRGILKLASVGRIAVVTGAPARRPRILNYRHVLDGLWYPGTASKYAASSFRWLKEAMWPDGSYREMDEAASRIAPGCDGLLFHPHLNGEWAPYWDDRLRGDFLGITARHSRAHLTRAVLEGVAFGLRDALSEVQAAGLEASDLRLIGQGSRSALWARIVADVVGRPLRLPVQTDAAYGAALITLIGMGALAPQAEALDRVIDIRESIEPDPATTARYERLFSIYRDADAALQPIAHRLYDFDRISDTT